MDGQNMVYNYNGILFSHKKELTSDPYNNMHEPCKHYAKQNKPDTEGQIL